MTALTAAIPWILGLFTLGICGAIFGKFWSSWRTFSFPVSLTLLLMFLGLSGVMVIGVGVTQALLGVGLAAGIILSFLQPVAAVCILVSQLLIRPWEVIADAPSLLGTLPRLLAAITFTSWLLHRLLRKRLSFVWNSSLTVFTFLFGWLLLSALLAPYAEYNLEDIFRIFLPIFGFCILLVNCVETKRDFALVTQSLTLALAAVIATALVYTLADPEFLTGGLRLQSVGQNGNTNDLAALTVLAIPFSYFSWMEKRKLKKSGSWVDVLCLVIFFTALILAKSRAAMLALGGAFGFHLFLTTRSKAKLLLKLSLLAPVAFGLFVVALHRDAADLEGSSDSRFNYILAGFKMLRAHPFFGVGVGNYPRFYDQFTLAYIETGERTAHSTWMLLLSETGLMGLLLFGILFYTSVKRAWSIRAVYPELLVSLFGYSITMTFLSHAYCLYPYLLFFLILSASRLPLPQSGDPLHGT